MRNKEELAAPETSNLNEEDNAICVLKSIIKDHDEVSSPFFVMETIEEPSAGR